MASGIDKGSFGGIALAIGGILLGLTLEGGRIAQLLQPTAALIVFGGTLGAVLLQFPLATVLTAFASLRKVFFEHIEDPVAVVTEMVGYAQKARASSLSTPNWKASGSRSSRSRSCWQWMGRSRRSCARSWSWNWTIARRGKNT